MLFVRSPAYHRGRPKSSARLKLVAGMGTVLRHAAGPHHPSLTVRDRDSIERARTPLDGFLAGAVPSQVDGDGLQDRIGHQLGERGG